MNTATDFATDFSNAGTVDSAADQAHRVVDRAEGKGGACTERAASAAHRTIDNVAKATAPAAQWMSENGKQLATRSTELADTCSNQVRARPFVSVAAALAVGYIVGKLIQH
jgi:ElaB/YqjD/DUF883 family membrane-anchored ribosome-binding protein